MNTKNIFIFMLIIILAIMYLKLFNENFKSGNNTNNSNTGVYNYFNRMIMNPYSQSLTTFFSDDISGSL